MIAMEPPPTYRPGRAPLLQALLPMGLGILLAGLMNLSINAGWLAAAGVVAVGCARGIARLSNGSAWRIPFALGLVCLGWAYGQWRLPPVPEQSGRPVREVLMRLQIDRVFPGDNDAQVRGFARVAQTDDHLKRWQDARVYFNLATDGVPVVAGSRIHVRAVLVETVQLEPSGFRTYLQRERAGGLLSRGRVLAVEREGSPFLRWCARVNQRGMQVFLGRETLRETSRPAAAITAAMTLGNKSGLTETQKTDFLSTGTMHLFAISGLHVGIIALTLELLLRLMRVPLRMRPVLGLAVLFVYVGIIGFSPSAVRAFTMVACYWLAATLGRQGKPWPALVLSAWLVLLWNPMQLWNIGFQLSYSVVAALILYGAPLALALERVIRPDALLPEADRSPVMRLGVGAGRWGVRLLAISFSATVASLPLTVGYFGVFSPAAIPLNLVLGLMAYGVINAGLSALLGAWLWPGGWFEPVASWLAYCCAGAMEGLVQTVVAVPGLVWYPLYTTSWLAPAALGAILLSCYWVSFRHETLAWRFAVPPLIALVALIAGLMGL